MWTRNIKHTFSRLKVFGRDCNCTAVGAVEQAGENTTATRENSKPSDQDKVQRLNERLAHSVMDLSRAKAEQNSPSTDKGRWVE